MAFDFFNKRKNDILSKGDKSHKGNWDEKIKDLCEKINSFADYYTTSSCSGRIVLMVDRDKKARGMIIKSYHGLISFSELKEDLKEILKRKEDIKLKMEPNALHVACRKLEDAEKLYNCAKSAGWKKSGVISFNKRFMVELNSTERLEFPVIRKGKILVDDEFLKVIVSDANKKLKRCWQRIEKLNEIINNLYFKK